MPGHLSDRADSYAQKLRPQAPKDDRTPDEKLAALRKEYPSSSKDILRKAHIKKRGRK